jgi:hypothetical protein
MEEDEDGGEVAEVTWGSKETSARAPYAKHGGQHLWLWCSPKSLKMFIGAEFTMSVQFAGNRGTCRGTCGALVDICLSCAVLTTPLLLALNLNLRPTSGNGRKGVYRKICDSSAYTLMNQSNTPKSSPPAGVSHPWAVAVSIQCLPLHEAARCEQPGGPSPTRPPACFLQPLGDGAPVGPGSRQRRAAMEGRSVVLRPHSI